MPNKEMDSKKKTRVREILWEEETESCKVDEDRETWGIIGRSRSLKWLEGMEFKAKEKYLFWP